VTDIDSPSLATRFRALLRGERDAAALEAMRGAGTSVFAELAEAEKTRTQMVAEGRDPWTAAPSVSGHLVATWNAFVLQSLAAGLLDADYAADAGTVGYVPPVTFDQAWAWFSTAHGWLSQARQARANPDFDLSATLRLPVDPPPWAEVEPCPRAHLEAMLAAIPPVREQAELAVYDLERCGTTPERARAVNTLRQLAAEAATAAEYATALWTGAAGQRLHELIEMHLKRALTIWFHLGQLAAMPALVEQYRVAPGPARVDLRTLPGGARFDPWCLTDRRIRGYWQADPKAQRAIFALWTADPEPARTLTLQAEVDAALRAGQITPTGGPGFASYYYCCPWSTIYQVHRPVVIGGRRLAVPQQFTLDISGEKLAEGGQFVRRVLVGPFRTTTEVDYCDPSDGGHHD
jgi:hypothetical protein